MKLPTRSSITATERDGVNYVRTVVEGANCIFHQIHVEDDYGNDALLELVDGTQVTGRMVAAQIKSGKSYCTETHCVIPTRDSQVNYWRSHSLQVIGIVYDPDEDAAYWVNIQERVRSRTFASPIRYEKTDLCRFDAESFARLFLPRLLRKPVRLDYETAVRFARDPRREMHSVGLAALHNDYRHEMKTWTLFAELLHDRPSNSLDPQLAYILATVPGHGDICWHSGNTISDELRKQVRTTIAGWGRVELLQMLRLMDMWEVGRGTIGQNVYAVIDLAVSDPGPKLRSLAEDTGIETESRQKALFLYCLVTQSKADSFLEELATRGEFIDVVRELQQTLKEYGFFPAQ